MAKHARIVPTRFRATIVAVFVCGVVAVSLGCEPSETSSDTEVNPDSEPPAEVEPSDIRPRRASRPERLGALSPLRLPTGPKTQQQQSTSKTGRSGPFKLVGSTYDCVDNRSPADRMHAENGRGRSLYRLPSIQPTGVRVGQMVGSDRLPESYPSNWPHPHTIARGGASETKKQEIKGHRGAEPESNSADSTVFGPPPSMQVPPLEDDAVVDAVVGTSIAASVVGIVDGAVADSKVNQLAPTLTVSAGTLSVHRAEAQRVVRHGFTLANRGMLFSGRREFLRALRLLASAKNATNRTKTHAGSLTAGLRTLDEVDDFQPRGSQLEAQIDMAMTVSSHHANLLEGTDLSETSPLAAIEAYYDHAAELLGAAVAGEPAGSMALYGLARIDDRLGQADGESSLASSERSVALFRAALLAHPRNELAASVTCDPQGYAASWAGWVG